MSDHVFSYCVFVWRQTLFQGSCPLCSEVGLLWQHCTTETYRSSTCVPLYIITCFLRSAFSKQAWASFYDIQWIGIDLMIWYWSLVCGLLTNNSKFLFITNAFSDYLKEICVFSLTCGDNCKYTKCQHCCSVALSKRCFVFVRIQSTWHTWFGQ